MKCGQCNRTVTRKSKFCPNCGSPIVPRTSQKKQAKPRVTPGLVALLLAVGLLGGFGLAKLFEEGEVTHTTASFPQGNTVANTIADIAQQFNCPCGQCDHRLDVCECEHPNGAHEIKGFIVEQLRQGHKKPHITEMVAARYGGLIKTAPPLKLEVPTTNN